MEEALNGPQPEEEEVVEDPKRSSGSETSEDEFGFAAPAPLAPTQQPKKKNTEKEGKGSENTGARRRVRTKRPDDAAPAAPGSRGDGDKKTSSLPVPLLWVRSWISSTRSPIGRGPRRQRSGTRGCPGRIIAEGR